MCMASTWRLADLARSELLEDSDASATQHQQMLDRIRAVDGFERFAGQVSWSALDARLSPEQPLVYVNPTPWGTMLLVLPGGRSPRVRFLELTSAEIAHGMIFGSSPWEPDRGRGAAAERRSDRLGVQRLRLARACRVERDPSASTGGRISARR
jgi:hypothetical protein